MLAPTKRFANAETGATSLEYGLVAAGIAIAAAFGSFDETAQLAATLCVAHARTCSKAPAARVREMMGPFAPLWDFKV